MRSHVLVLLLVLDRAHSSDFEHEQEHRFAEQEELIPLRDD